MTMTNPDLWRPDPIAELEVECRSCHHGYLSHEAGGGHCRGIISNGPWSRLPCMCAGMKWVSAEVPPGRNYSTPPSSSYGESPGPAELG